MDLDTKTKVLRLIEAKRSIRATLDEFKEEIIDMKRENKILVDPDTVVNFSRRISLTVRAPHLWQPGYPLDIAFGHGPCPQLEEYAGGYLRRYQMTSNQLLPSRDDTANTKMSRKRSMNMMDETMTPSTPLSSILEYVGIIYDKNLPGSTDSLNQNVKIEEDKGSKNKKSRSINMSFDLSDSEED